METLKNNKQSTKSFSRFSVPGFRSGSTIKKIIACVYYCFVFINIIVNGVATAFEVDFQGASDVILYILFLLCAVGAYLSPVIIIGFSDYYDLHGIKLVLAIVSAMSIFMTCSFFVSSYFSDELKGINTEIEETSDEKKDEQSPESHELENDLIKEHIEQSDENKADSSAENE